MTSGVEVLRTTDVDDVWPILIEIYAEVRSDRLHEPHYSAERYGERLARHASEPGWEVLVGFDGSEPVGYVYVNTIHSGDRWWRRMTTPLPANYVNTPTLAFKEGMLRRPWRGHGLARKGHDELLRGRREEQVSLLVDPLAGDGKVKGLYESWGYEEIGTQQPSSDGPVLTVMLRAVRPAEA